jgi:RNA polymerase sigma-70 factor (ECF subfamily)
MALIARGDVGALEAVYDRYSRVAYSLALRVLRDRGAAEEVVQDAFMSVWRSARSYDPGRGSLYAWLVRTVRNRAIDELRRLEVPGRAPHAIRRAAPPELLESLASPEAASGPELRVAVAAALKELPDDQRQVIELAYFEGYSQREISENTGIPLGTVKTRTRLALGKLREAFDLGPTEAVRNATPRQA